MQITILQAILLGLFCFLVSTGMFPLGWLSMNIMSKPLIHCMIIGLIMGDMKNALIIGCVIQAAYIGQMSIGGVATLPSINVAVCAAADACFRRRRSGMFDDCAGVRSSSEHSEHRRQPGQSRVPAPSGRFD